MKTACAGRGGGGGECVELLEGCGGAMSVEQTSVVVSATLHAICSCQREELGPALEALDAAAEQLSSVYVMSPVLLDEFLKQWVSACSHVVHVRKERRVEHKTGADRRTGQNRTDAARRAAVLRFLCTCSRVFGRKKLERALPNDTSFFAAVCEEFWGLGEAGGGRDGDSEVIVLQERYILLLALSAIISNPVELALRGNSASEQRERWRIGDAASAALAEQCWKCLGDAAATRDAAAVVLGRLLARCDAGEDVVHSILNRSSVLLVKEGNDLLRVGVLSMLCELVRCITGESLMRLSGRLWELAQQAVQAGAPTSAIVRKLRAKFVQRLAVFFLRERERRGELSAGFVDKNRVGDDARGELSASTRARALSSEQALQQLLSTLSDPDIDVRGSAAKGIARICSCMWDLEEEEEVHAVFSAVLAPVENVKNPDSIPLWHGSCLALAELGRRVPMQQSLLRAVPVVLRALHCDVRTGRACIGATVRDAACSALQAFVCACESRYLQELWSSVARELVLAALCDREVHVRRAAAVALQKGADRGQQRGVAGVPGVLAQLNCLELGRLPLVEGISAVARFPEYRTALLEHVLSVMLPHWDFRIRVLAAAALRELALLENRFVSLYLPRLLSSAESLEEPALHGGLSALVVVLPVLSLKQSGKNAAKAQDFDLPTELVERVVQLPGMRGRSDRTGRRVRLLGSSVIRASLCRLVAALGLASLPVAPAARCSIMSMIEENLAWPDDDVQAAAADAWEAFCASYCSPTSVGLRRSVDRLLEALSSQRQAAGRRGCAEALGRLPRRCMCTSSSADGVGCCTMFKRVLLGLHEATAIPSCPEWDDVLMRRNALRALVHLTLRAGVASLEAEEVESCFVDLRRCAADYTRNVHGDAGSAVRLMAVDCMCELLEGLQSESPELVTPVRIRMYLLTLFDAATGNLDRMRAAAGRLLHRAVLRKPQLQIPLRVELEASLLAAGERSHDGSVDWTSPETPFRVLLPLLECAQLQSAAEVDLRQCIVRGFVLAMGCQGGGGLAEASAAVVVPWLGGVEQEVLVLVAQDVASVLAASGGTARMKVPFLRGFAELLRMRCFVKLHQCSSESCARFVACVVMGVSKYGQDCQSIPVLLAVVEVLCGLLFFPSAIRQAVAHLLCLLGHPYPRVRSATAAAMLKVVPTVRSADACCEAAAETALRPVVELLRVTNWLGEHAVAQAAAKSEVWETWLRSLSAAC